MKWNQKKIFQKASDLDEAERSRCLNDGKSEFP